MNEWSSASILFFFVLSLRNGTTGRGSRWMERQTLHQFLWVSTNVVMRVGPGVRGKSRRSTFHNSLKAQGAESWTNSEFRLAQKMDAPQHVQLAHGNSAVTVSCVLEIVETERW